MEWVPLPIGWTAIHQHGEHTPPSTVGALAELDGWLLGPHDSAAYPEPHRSRLNPSGALRKRFDLFANIRPAKGVPGSTAVAPDADLVIVRENTEGFYADRNTYAGTGEFMPSPDVAIAMGVFTRPRVERIARVAFDLARQRRRRVTIVHKANVLQLSSGLFRDVRQPRGRRRLPRRRGRRPAHRRHDRPPGAPGGRLRRDRHREHVRRHPSPTSPASSPAPWAWPPPSTPPSARPWPRRRTARPPTSPAGTSPTRCR